MGAARAPDRSGRPVTQAPSMNFPSRLRALLGIRHPIVQGGMSWASSCAALPLAVSRAGALGVIAAGPMRPAALVEAIRAVRAGTDQPFAVNIPLYNKRAAEFLDIAEAERVPILIASQGGPKPHLPRFRAIGTKWVHVVASPQHAAKAEAAPAAPAAPASAAPKPLHNRETAQRPSAGVPAVSPVDKAAKIRNRAQEIATARGCSFMVAFRAAEQEFGEVR